MIVFNIDSAKELEEIIERAVQKVLSDKISAEPTQDPLYNRKQAAEYLNISLGTLHTHTKKGRIQGQRIGSRLLYRKSDLDNSTTVTNKSHI
jgi:excisionase family DNA binding protein